MANLRKTKKRKIFNNNNLRYNRRRVENNDLQQPFVSTNTIIPTTESLDSIITDFETTDFETTNFETTDFETTDFVTTNFETTDFVTTNFETTDFVTTNFETTNFETTDFETTNPSTSCATITNFNSYEEADILSTTSMPQKITEPLLDGRRIVDIRYLLNNLKEIGNHNDRYGCSFNNLEIIKETRHGFASTIHFMCNMCQIKLQTSTIKDNDNMDINTAAVAGTMSIGCGFSNMEELFNSMSIPCMNQKQYNKYHEIVSKGWQLAAIKNMKNAANKESELAIEANDVDSNGIPLISVVCDGCWSKRSYRSNYSALSGVAAIVGKRTGQVLYIGVKNKFCTVCSRAVANNKQAADHICFKNYEGSSSSMESAIILEGFKESLKIYGLKYSKMIADGDSSTYKKILEARPYQDLTVEKVECRNHLLRNFCNKVRTLATNTAYPINLRKWLNDKTLLRMRRSVIGAIRYRKQEDNRAQAITSLKKDIDNILCHVFGRHVNCAEYFCEKKEELDKYYELERSQALHMRLMQYIKYLSNHSRSLIQDVDSNVAEQFNNIVAKFVGGKRVNYSLRQSYQGRCSGAVVAFNTKRPHYELHKAMYGRSPSRYIKKLEMLRSMKAKRATSLRQIKKQVPRTTTLPKRKETKHDTFGDPNYGEHCQQPDMDKQLYDEETNKFLSAMKLNHEDRVKLERETILQSESGIWIDVRRKLLTASNFHRVCKRRADTSCTKLVRELLYDAKHLNIPSLRHGRTNEPIAIAQLEVQENIKILPAGLFVDEELFYLGASPDGLVGDDLIVEIKCPSSAFNMDPNDAIKNGKIQMWKLDDDDICRVQTNVSWYYQVQGQLHITKRQTCLFAVWTGEKFPMKTAYIERDDIFWEENMKNKLCLFYMDCILPELVDPRYTRNMVLRDPVYILEAIKNKELKKIEKIEKQKKKGMPKPTKRVLFK